MFLLLLFLPNATGLPICGHSTHADSVDGPHRPHTFWCAECLAKPAWYLNSDVFPVNPLHYGCSTFPIGLKSVIGLYLAVKASCKTKSTWRHFSFLSLSTGRTSSAPNCRSLSKYAITAIESFRHPANIEREQMMTCKQLNTRPSRKVHWPAMIAQVSTSCRCMAANFYQPIRQRSCRTV